MFAEGVSKYLIRWSLFWSWFFLISLMKSISLYFPILDMSVLLRQDLHASIVLKSSVWSILLLGEMVVVDLGHSNHITIDWIAPHWEMVIETYWTLNINGTIQVIFYLFSISLSVQITWDTMTLLMEFHLETYDIIMWYFVYKIYADIVTIKRIEWERANSILGQMG